MFDKGSGGFMGVVNSYRIKLLMLYKILCQYTGNDHILSTNQKYVMNDAKNNQLNG